MKSFELDRTALAIGSFADEPMSKVPPSILTIFISATFVNASIGGRGLG